MRQPPASPAPPDAILWALPLGPMDWALPPPAVPEDLQSLPPQITHLPQHVDTLQGRGEQTSHTSRQPPASDAPFDKPTRPQRQASGTRGGRPGHSGTGPTVLRPPAGPLLAPGPGGCGHGARGALAPSDPHHVVALPPSEMASAPCLVPQGPWRGGGRTRTAQGPRAPQAGDGPRVTARLGALAGMPRPSRRLRQACGHSVLHIPRRWGAVPTSIARVSPARVPHDEAMAPLARHAPVGSREATPWDGHTALHGRWTLRPKTVARALLPPQRAQAAWAAWMEDGPGIGGSDGSGVAQGWGQHRQPGLAPRIRTARGVSDKRAPPLAACGPWTRTA